MVKVFLMIGLVVVVLFGGYLGLAFILQRVDKAPSPGSDFIEVKEATTSGGTKTTKVTNESASVDPQIISNWDTGCLVPDPKSPWAERHTFSLNSDGTGSHQRYSGSSCAAIGPDLHDDFTWVIPERGKINLSYTSGIIAGSTIYDVYQVSGSTLKFGHGFCNCATTDGNFGVSESERFTIPNNFLVYKKQ